MKKRQQIVFTAILGIITLLLATSMVYAVPGQWSAGGTVIYYNDGNIGLGTSTPQSKLHISGSDLIIDKGDTASSLVAADGNIILRMDRDGDGTGSNHVSVQNYVGGYLLSVRPNGNVGIGTFNPTQKLSVNGTVLAKEVIVSTAAGHWPDYVFSDNYSLLPLSTLAEYIKTNRHLPNVPAASEVEKSGQSLGGIQIKQMEKIEELTLYILQQNERITELENKLSLISK